MGWKCFGGPTAVLSSGSVRGQLWGTHNPASSSLSLSPYDVTEACASPVHLYIQLSLGVSLLHSCKPAACREKSITKHGAAGRRRVSVRTTRSLSLSRSSQVARGAAREGARERDREPSEGSLAQRARSPLRHLHTASLLPRTHSLLLCLCVCIYTRGRMCIRTERAIEFASEGCIYCLTPEHGQERGVVRSRRARAYVRGARYVYIGVRSRVPICLLACLFAPLC